MRNSEATKELSHYTAAKYKTRRLKSRLYPVNYETRTLSECFEQLIAKPEDSVNI